MSKDVGTVTRSAFRNAVKRRGQPAFSEPHFADFVRLLDFPGTGEADAEFLGQRFKRSRYDLVRVQAAE
jgi:hypothetical protein